MRHYLSALTVILSMGMVAQAGIVNFDSYSPGTVDPTGSGWIHGGTNGVVDNSLAYSGSNSYRFASAPNQDPALNGSLTTSIADHAQTTWTLSTWIRFGSTAPGDSSTTASTFVLDIRDEQPTRRYAGKIMFYSHSQKIQVVDKTGFNLYSATIPLDEWIKTEVVMNENTQKWNFSLAKADGTDLFSKSNLTFYDTNIQKIDYVSLYNIPYKTFGHDVRIDDLTLVPEPMTLSLLTAGAGVMLLRRK